MASCLLLPVAIQAQSVSREARRLFADGRYGEAITVFEAARIVEKDSLAAIETGIRDAKECIRLKSTADGYLEAGNHVKAQTVYEQLLSLNPVDKYAATQIARCRTLEAQTRQAAEKAAAESDRKREDRIWNSAAAGDSEEAFRSYLDRYPQGRYIEKAKRGLERIADKRTWDEAVRTDTEAAYADYLERYPDGVGADDVALWKQTVEAKTAAAYQAYITAHPKGAHAGKAGSQLNVILADEEFWRETVALDTKDAFLDYLRRSEMKTHKEKASLRLQQIYLSLAGQSLEREQIRDVGDNISRAESFGALSTELRQKADSLRIAVDSLQAAADYRRVVTTLYIPTAENYLDKYPATPHRAEVEKRISRLKTKERLERAAPHPLLGLGIKIGGFRSTTITIPAYLMLRNDYNVVNFITGIEYTYDSKDYDRDYFVDVEGSASRNPYRISAHQFSIPVTLKFNIKTGRDAGQLYLSATGLYNMNLTGKCFRIHDSRFVNRRTWSAVAAIGYDLYDDDDGAIGIELFVRKDFQPHYNRAAIYEADDFFEYNNYSVIDRVIRNTVFVGASLMIYIPLK
jgi:hypothetical protein